MHAFLSSADSIFSKSTFLKILLGLPSGYQTVWFQIRPEVMSGLILVQTVCKDYQQMTRVGEELNVKPVMICGGYFCFISDTQQSHLWIVYLKVVWPHVLLMAKLEVVKLM